MNPNTSFSFLEQGERNKRWHDGFLPGSGFLYNSLPLDSVGWHDDSLPGAGSLYNSVPLDSVGWHGDSPPEAGFPVRRESGGGQRIIQVCLGKDGTPVTRAMPSSTSSILRATRSTIPACPSGVAEDATTFGDPDHPASAEFLVVRQLLSIVT